MPCEIPPFKHAERGLARFPPNIEQITVRRESGRVWLVARRNDVRIEFPLSDDDADHLAKLLTGRESAA